MVVQMVGVGEQTGALDAMLSKIADFYEEEVDVAVAGLLTLHRADHDGRHRRHRRRRAHRDVPADLLSDQSDRLMTPASEIPAAGGPGALAAAAPSRSALRWLIGLRLVVISTLFLGILIIQVNTQQLLQLEEFYWLILVSYGLSLGYLVLYLKGLPTRLQAVVQLLGDIGVVTGCVYFTGGLYSPSSRSST